MGNPQRQKGDRFERVVVDMFNSAGQPAQRVPLSGAAGGHFAGDIKTEWLGQPKTLECKKRADGFKEIYKWLDDHDGLVIAADRKQPIICLPLDNFLDILSIFDLQQQDLEAAE